MKKNMIAGAALGMALVLGMSVSVAASSFAGSKTQQSVAAVEATITTSSGETLETVVGTTEDLTNVTEEAGAAFGEVNEAGEVVSIDTIQEPIIKITPVSETQKANDDHSTKEENSGKSFYEKAADITSSGLSYSTNDQTNLVYEVAAKSEDTRSFLEKFEGLTEKVVQTIKEIIAETTEEYASAEDVLDEEADVSVYSPLALFDVSANQAAKDAIGETGSVKITAAVDGAKEDSRGYVLHFQGEEEDVDEARAALEADFNSAILKYNVEVLPCSFGDGTVTFEMSSFSPVMVMVQETAEEEAVEETTEEPAEEEPAEEVTEDVTEEPAETESSNNFLLWIIIIIIVAVVIIYLAMKGRKKDDTQDSADKK